jgi:hypothetical protein
MEMLHAELTAEKMTAFNFYHETTSNAQKSYKNI